MGIADWPEDERPRERLLRHGAGVLTESELLAIFLRTGIGGRNAVELGRDLLAPLRMPAAALCRGAGRSLGRARSLVPQSASSCKQSLRGRGRALRYCLMQQYPCSRWRTRPEKWIAVSRITSSQR
jgi:DNA repair protein RadC